jgi:hypothetical protein
MCSGGEIAVEYLPCYAPELNATESVVRFWFEAFRSKRQYLSEGAVTETDDILGIALKGKPHNSSLNRDGKTTCRPLARR